MQFIGLMRRRTEAFSEADFALHLDAEAARVRQLYIQGVIRSAFSRDDVLGAVLLFEVPDAAAAQSAVDSLPLFALGMLEATLIPLKPYRGFS